MSITLLKPHDFTALEQINNSSCAQAVSKAMELARAGVTPRAAILQHHGFCGGMPEPTWEDALQAIYVECRVINVGRKI